MARHAALLLTFWASTTALAAAQPTWPSPATDELEDLLLLQSGYRARAFSAPVTPCGFSAAGAGRVTAAEWIRTAFHDMATANRYQGTGGVDASLAFELNSGENEGQAFNTTLLTLAPFMSARSSASDLIALALRTAVRACGGPAVPLKAGRVDATAGGPIGVPLPQNSVGTFTNQFDRTGFNVSDMIALVACGHTLGGVHSANFPEIVPAASAPADGLVKFDTTDAYDNKVVTEYLANATLNPLVVGPSVANGRNSDARVFAADGNATVRAMADAAAYQSTCQRVLQQMIEVVPAGVVLTAPIEAYEVKPTGLQLALLDGGEQLGLTGDIRVRTTQRAAAGIEKVALVYKDRDGASAGELQTTDAGSGAGFDDTFEFYSVDAKIPANASISAFDVVVTLTSGETETYDNGGAGFPVQDRILFQSPQSCLSGTVMTVVAAVRNTETSPAPKLNVTLQAAVRGSVLPKLQASNVAMTKGSTVGPYDLYSASYTLLSNQTTTTHFDVSLGIVADSFKASSGLSATCVDLSPDPPTTTPSPTSSTTPTSSSTLSSSSTIVSSSSTTILSSSTTAISSSTTAISSSTPTPTDYTYLGCYTDSVSSRTLTGAVTYDSANMTIPSCFASCASFQFFGVEYGGECYCGNTSPATNTTGSALVADTECNTACPGAPDTFCGAPDRLSAYRNDAFVGAANPVVAGWSYQGCFNDSAVARVLDGAATSADDMTVEACADFCAQANVFGVEYGRECYCGAQLDARAAQQPEAQCGMRCAGAATEWCGDASRLSVWEKGG